MFKNNSSSGRINKAIIDRDIPQGTDRGKSTIDHITTLEKLFSFLADSSKVSSSLRH